MNVAAIIECSPSAHGSTAATMLTTTVALMLRLLLPTIVAAAAAILVSAQPNSIFVVRQTGGTLGTANLQLISLPYGDITITSNLTFGFENPLVECTVDSVNQMVYLVTIDVKAGGSILYQLDDRLNVVQTWTTPASNDFFDLQYNPTQSALYGISVVSQYGRVLSNITASPNNYNNVTVDHLVTMPFGWYVNASSFDMLTNNYFALLNQFPGNANWTAAQKLVVADFSGVVTPAPAAFYDLPTGGVVHFIGSDAINGGRVLWALSQGPGFTTPNPDVITLITLNPQTGGYDPIGDFGAPNQYNIGPLSIDVDGSGNPYFFVLEQATGLWVMVYYDAAGDNTFHTVRKFDPSHGDFRAAAYAPW